MWFTKYESEGFFDEMIAADGSCRPGSSLIMKAIDQLPEGELRRRQNAAESVLKYSGITFNVYESGEGKERIWPFDIIPRVIPRQEWEHVERGLKQRILAINLFIADLYSDQQIVKDGIFPEELLRSSKGYLPQCHDLHPPFDAWSHITGSDLVRDDDGTFYVLEDNLRVPSGVSYVLANRDILKRTFPEVFARSNVMPVYDYPARLLKMLYDIAPPSAGDPPTVAVLTPGVYNSAYFEHTYLAQQLGAELVEGRDLICENNFIYMKTTQGLQQVDVIYRRVNDEYLDPEVFKPDSVLGVAGLMRSMRAGNVALANAPGTGVADDKVVYAFIPEIIKYYLDEEILLPNVPTYCCYREKELAYTLEHLADLVVKPANESGGYGMLVGPKSSREEIATFRDIVKANPRNYIAQPTLNLSRAPVIVDGSIEGRHIDMRPFVLHGQDTYTLPGGLTRVALRKGSLVVNSSQGGGSKDTWIVDPVEDPSC